MRILVGMGLTVIMVYHRMERISPIPMCFKHYTAHHMARPISSRTLRALMLFMRLH